MNERIFDLAEQAYEETYRVMGSTCLQEAFDDFYTEKFAELLVRECAKFMDENSGYNDSDGCWFPEPEDMLKHFGVEE